MLFASTTQRQAECLQHKPKTDDILIIISESISTFILLCFQLTANADLKKK